jgi:hypothetical protein
MRFRDFWTMQENLWGNIPGNPAFGGKKPSDGNGVNPYNQNKSNSSGGMPPGVPGTTPMPEQAMKSAKAPPKK